MVWQQCIDSPAPCVDGLAIEALICGPLFQGRCRLRWLVFGFGTDRFEQGSHFCNKIWNAARYVLMNCEEEHTANDGDAPVELSLADRWIIDRFGPKWMIRAGILTLGSGFLLLSTIDSIAGFYGAIVVIAIGSSLCGFFPLNVAVINWFEKYRARYDPTQGSRAY